MVASLFSRLRTLRPLAPLMRTPRPHWAVKLVNDFAPEKRASVAHLVKLGESEAAIALLLDDPGGILYEYTARVYVELVQRGLA